MPFIYDVKPVRVMGNQW